VSDPLASIDRTFGDKREELRVSVDEYNGRRYVSIRVWSWVVLRARDFAGLVYGQWRPERV